MQTNLDNACGQMMENLGNSVKMMQSMSTMMEDLLQRSLRIGERRRR